MTYREVPHYLINKYHLSPEDTEDVRNEIAISDLEYGYQRNIEHIIIDYFEKTKHYKQGIVINLTEVCYLNILNSSDT